MGTSPLGDSLRITWIGERGKGMAVMVLLLRVEF